MKNNKCNTATSEIDDATTNISDAKEVFQQTQATGFHSLLSISRSRRTSRASTLASTSKSDKSRNGMKNAATPQVKNQNKFVSPKRQPANLILRDTPYWTVIHKSSKMQQQQKTPRAPIKECKKPLAYSWQGQKLVRKRQNQVIESKKEQTQFEEIQDQRLTAIDEDIDENFLYEMEDRIEDYQECPICFSFMIEPIQLEYCMHAYCLKCVNKTFEDDLEKKCPLCRMEHYECYRYELNARDLAYDFQYLLRDNFQEKFDKKWLDTCKPENKDLLPAQENTILVKLQVKQKIYQNKSHEITVSLMPNIGDDQPKKKQLIMSKARNLIEKVELETFGGGSWLRKDGDDCEMDGQYVFRFNRYAPIFLGYVHIRLRKDSGFMGSFENLFTLEFHEPNYQEDIFIPFDKVQFYNFLIKHNMQRIKFWYEREPDSFQGKDQILLDQFLKDQKLENLENDPIKRPQFVNGLRRQTTKKVKQAHEQPSLLPKVGPFLSLDK